MAYCTSCGKKLKAGAKSCPRCNAGKKRRNITQIVSIILVAIIFIGLLGFATLFLTQRTTPEDTEFYRPSELIDTTIQITQPESEKAPIETRRTGFRADEKPFETGNYVYDERTQDFRLVCTNPCPVPKSVLDQEFASIAYAVSTLRGITQSDIESYYLPFEVHASADERCEFDPTSYLAYMSSYTDSNGYNRGLLCFFFDELPYNRDKFPYSTSVHEVTHLFEADKIPGSSVIWEGLSEMMESFFLKGNIRSSFCWQGNDWYKEEQYRDLDSPHNTGRELFFELCNRYSFDYDSLPALFREIDRRGEVSIQEFVQIINSIVGADTSQVFREAGLNVYI